MPPFTIQQAFDLAQRHHKAGRLREAEELYRHILASQPDDARALHFLGMAVLQRGQPAEALELLRRASAIHPEVPQTQNHLGLALKENGKLDEAIAAFRRAIALWAEYVEARNNLGNALRQQRRFAEAIAEYRRAIALSPDSPGVHNNLGVALKENGQPDDAITAYRRAVAIKPDYALAHNNLAEALKDKGQVDEAIAAFRRCISLNPSLFEPRVSLAQTLQAIGKLDDAIAAYRAAITLRPEYAEGHYNLGLALKHAGQLDDAIAAYRRAITLRPAYSEAHNNLGLALKDAGRIDDALYAFRQAIAADPALVVAHSNLVYMLHFDPAADALAIAEEQRRWNLQHAQPLAKLIQPHPNDHAPDRRLRIGYVSADLREHVIGQSLLPLLQHHDHGGFEIFCYAGVARPDGMTEKLRAHVDQWRDVVKIDDAALAEMIRADGIDILVDLNLHMAGSRLLTFARKPAPVQVTYLGYNGSTGLTAMDYRLSDPHFDPPGGDLSCNSEKTVRLPKTWWCYRPRPCGEPSPPPALKNGFVTFGCINNFAKVSPAALELWAQILLATPNSRLILHAQPGAHRKRVAERLEQSGVGEERLHFVGLQQWAEHMQTYSQIDIALDPFPYGGGITTLDALWMGVAVVTLAGQTSVGRGGRSILANLGLQEFIAESADQYARIAIELARDVDRMSGLRQELRARMLASPLMDAGTFARDVEAAYRGMWHAWCEAKTHG